MIKLAKMPQNMKPSDRFRTVFDSAVLCQLFRVPYAQRFNLRYIFQGSQWPILPWLVLDFIRLAAKLIIFVMVIIVWAVYMGENEDSSYIVATGVLGAAALGKK